MSSQICIFGKTRAVLFEAHTRLAGYQRRVYAIKGVAPCALLDTLSSGHSAGN